MAKKVYVSLLLILFALTGVVFAGQPKVMETKEYIIYIPSGLDYNTRHPLLIGLSPAGDAHAAINALRGISDQYKWIIFASKEYRNGVDPLPILNSIADILENLFSSLPIDRAKIIATGLSGGGMGAHSFAFYHPELISAIIVNTGMIHEYFYDQKFEYEYPRKKLAVFLASPTDFRYNEMKRDRDFLEKIYWKIKWIEFQGGHTYAPDSTYQEAAEWLVEQF